ncbi:hyalin-like [Patiria miniata]|uniref:HYR domain-containing protein n=1 Tax=Patiria miniata TaxID=46514 RepID=A0A914ANG1_PATMI|nr:hyalin-like [Patiria miniata]
MGALPYLVWVVISFLATQSCVVDAQDTEAPTLTCPTDQYVSTDNGLATAYVPWSAFPYSFDNEDGFKVCDITCQDQLGDKVEFGGTYKLGTTVVTCSTNDTAGNRGTCNFAITVTDDELPEVSCPSNVPHKETDIGMAFAVVPWSPMPNATDNVDGVLYPSNITCVDDISNTVSSNDTYGVGTTTVTCSASDTAGNQGFCQFNITVIDNEPPKVTCPSNLPDIPTYIGMAFAVVPWSAMPNATDNVDGVVDPINITCVDDTGKIVMSNGIYAVGTTTVTCNATDTAGNQGSCQLNITVVDTEPPEVTCASNVPNKGTDIGVAFAVVPWSPVPNATDNVDGLLDPSNITCVDGTGETVRSNDTYAIGTTTVTCNATDTAGNQGSCQFYIRVMDIEPPTVTCPNNVHNISTDIGMAYAVVSWSPMPNATDNVDGLLDPSNITCVDDFTGKTVRPNDTYGVGTTAVTCNAADTAGNRGFCQFSITVEDKEVPQIICPDSVPSKETDIGEAVVRWSPMPSATDNVDSFTINDIACHDGAGDVVVSNGTYSLGTTTVTCRVSDNAHNEGSCKFTIKVVGCQVGQHKCSNGVCIPRSQVCDNFNDCGDYDNSDEKSTLCVSECCPSRERLPRIV